MNKNNKDLLLEVSQYVTDLFRTKLPEWAVYHNLGHTKETVDMSFEIGSYYNLKIEEIKILTVSAWFHDTGYIYGPDSHEEKSIVIANKFLRKKDLALDEIAKISKCILATKITNKPGDLIENIICDSDLISLGKPDYFITNNKLKVEFELRENITIPALDWLARSEKFLRDHIYYTGYVKERYNNQLNKNLIELRNKINFENTK